MGIEDIPVKPVVDTIDIMSLERLYVVAPIATLVLTVAAVGGLVVWLLTKAHIQSLREFIDYLKNRNNC